MRPKQRIVIGVLRAEPVVAFGAPGCIAGIPDPDADIVGMPRHHLCRNALADDPGIVGQRVLTSVVLLLSTYRHLLPPEISYRSLNLNVT